MSDQGPLGAQVVVDVPRTAPEVAVFHQQPMQKSLERILFIWGIRRAPQNPQTLLALIEHTPDCTDSISKWIWTKFIRDYFRSCMHPASADHPSQQPWKTVIGNWHGSSLIFYGCAVRRL